MAMRQHQPKLGDLVKVLEVKSLAFHRCLTVRYSKLGQGTADGPRDVSWELGVVHHDLQATALSRWLFNSAHCGCDEVQKLASNMVPGTDTLLWPSARSQQMRGQTRTSRLPDSESFTGPPKATMANTAFVIFYFLRHAVVSAKAINLKLRKKAFQVLEAFLQAPPMHTEFHTRFGTIQLEGAPWPAEILAFSPQALTIGPLKA